MKAAHGAGVTPDHIAVPLLGIASSLVGTSRRVQVQRSWTEPLTLWAALIGASGSGKTPGLETLTKPLAVITRDRASNIDELRREHETRQEIAKATLKNWKAAVKEATDNGSAHPPKPPEADDPGPFIGPRLFVSDATIERLSLLLTGSPWGLLVLVDELSGLFSNMGRYSNGKDNDFWLKAYTSIPHVGERMGRPSISLRYLLIGLIGGIQPDKLTECFQGPNDGMYARFLFSWPLDAQYRKLDDAAAEIEPDIYNAFDRLSKLGGEAKDFNPVYISLDKEALGTFEEFREFHTKKKDELDDGRERHWWSKAPGHVLRLAGTLAFLAWAMFDDDEPKVIRRIYIQRAISLTTDYFYPHSRAALHQVGITERE
jgi:hypothetical protein